VLPAEVQAERAQSRGDRATANRHRSRHHRLSGTVSTAVRSVRTSSRWSPGRPAATPRCSRQSGPRRAGAGRTAPRRWPAQNGTRSAGRRRRPSASSARGRRLGDRPAGRIHLRPGHAAVRGLILGLVAEGVPADRPGRPRAKRCPLAESSAVDDDHAARCDGLSGRRLPLRPTALKSLRDGVHRWAEHGRAPAMGLSCIRPLRAPSARVCVS
jgi:hypothetical protein